MIFNVDTLFDKSPIWLSLFDVPESPAIHLTPLDWTEYELCRRMACVLGTNIAKPAAMMAQLVKATAPDAWRGFERSGEPAAFDAELLVKLLCANLQLGVSFDNRLQAIAAQQRQQAVDAEKNSAGGRVMKPSAPRRKPKAEPVPA